MKSKAQFISIFIMATLSVTIVTGLDSVWKTIEDRANVIYAAANTSDLWVNVVNPTEKELWSISRINGVEKVERRFTMNAIAELKGSPTLRVYAIPARGALDRPKLQQGSFSSRGGAILDEVAVFCTRKENVVCFSIEDNGTGVPEDELQKIFDPFYTSDKGRSVAGLGLSICKEIVEACGGKIWAKKNESGGTSIKIHLPV